MLHIAFTILKIIGIIIATILGILVLLICIVLFTPLRYQIEASADGDISSIRAKMKFSWLFHVFSGFVSYEEKQADFQIKIFGKKIDLEKSDSKHSEESPKTESPKEESRKVESLKEESLREENQESGSENDANIEKDIRDEKVEMQKKTASSPESKKVSKDLKGSKKKSKYTIQTICDKIRKLKENKEKLEDFIRHEIHIAAFKRVVKEIFRFFRFLKPKKFQLNLHFGFEDPSLTGKVLGAISMLYPFFEKHIDIEPDFQNTVLEGNIYIKGHVRCVYVLIIGWNLLFDKNIRKTFKDIKKLIDNK